MTPLLLPTSAIDAAALPRDRSTLDPQAQDLLQRSLLTEGLRAPIEVFALATPAPPLTHGLICGLRRLTAFRALHALTGNPTWTTIPAYIRTPASIPAALAAMVSENEVREPVSPWEKAQLILTCVEDEHFPTPDAAIAGLFPLLDTPARSRLRTIIMVVCELQDHLTDGPAWSLRQLLRLSTALKAGFGEVMKVALNQHHLNTQSAQWELLQNILTEADLSLKDPVAFDPPPKRLSRPHPRGGLTIRREWLPNGWRLVFTGPEAKGMMIESVFAEIERQYGPPPT